MIWLKITYKHDLFYLSLERVYIRVSVKKKSIILVLF